MPQQETKSKRYKCIASENEKSKQKSVKKGQIPPEKLARSIFWTTLIVGMLFCSVIFVLTTIDFFAGRNPNLLSVGVYKHISIYTFLLF